MESYLEGVYCGPISVETSHLSTQEERQWMAGRFEELRRHSFSPEERRRLATLMLQSQVRPVTHPGLSDGLKGLELNASSLRDLPG